MSVTSDGATIQLGDQTVTLQFSLKAAKTINGYFGNFVEAYQRIGKMDIHAYTAVIAAGLGKTVHDVEQSVFATGMDSLAVDIADYLAWLTNGGKKPNPLSAFVPAEPSETA